MMDRERMGSAAGLAVNTPVYSSDGEELGKVKEIRGRYFKVDAPMQPDYWLGMDAIGSRSGTTGDGSGVYLTIPKSRLSEYTIANPDEVDTTTGRMTDYRATDTDYRTGSTYGTMRSGQEMGTDTEEERRIRLNEEQLQATKRPVQAGEATVQKEVHEEQRSINVPVRHEEVYVERRPVSGDATGAQISDDGSEIHVPVMEEEVEVQKRPVAREEIVVGKREVEDTQQVSDTVRREEAHVETSGDVQVNDSGRRGMSDERKDRRS